MKSKAGYNKWAATYDEVENVTRDMDARITEQILTNYSFSKVLELGCGTGKNTGWLITVASQIWSVDFSENMLAKAKEKIQGDKRYNQQPNKVTFHLADITQPFEFLKNKVDLVTCNLTMEHIENIGAVFKNAANALDKNGLFFFSEYHPFRQYLGKQARFENEGEVVYVEAFVHHVSDYLDAANTVGFELLELKEWFDEDIVGGAPRVLSGVFRKGTE